MFLLTVQIPFLQLIMKVEREWYKMFFEEMRSWSRQFGFSFRNLRKDAMFFTCPDLTLHNVTNIAQALTKCSGFLEQWQEETEGYIILLDYQSGKEQSPAGDTFSYLSRITEFSHTWLTSAATALLDNTTVSDGVFLHKFYKPSSDRYPLRQFFAPKHVLGPIRTILHKHISKVPQQLILFSAERFSGFEITLGEALSQSFSHWYWWMFCENSQDVLDPFQRFFLNYHPLHPQNDDPHYQMIERMRCPTQNLFPENSWKELQEGFRYMLEKQQEERGRGVVVVEWMDRWPLESLRYLFSVAEDFPITIVAFSPTAVLPFPKGMKMVHYHFTPEKQLPGQLSGWLKRMSESQPPLIFYNLMRWHDLRPFSRERSAAKCAWPSIIGQHLSPLSLEVLYIIVVLGDMVNNGDILEIIQREKLDGLRIVLIMRNLVEMGFLFSMDNSHLNFRLSAEELGSLLQDRKALDEGIANYVYQQILKGRWRPGEKIFYTISSCLSHDHYLILLLLTTQHLLDCLQNPHSLLQRCQMACSDKKLSRQIQIVQMVSRVEWKIIRGERILEYDSEQLFQIEQASLSEQLYAQVNATQAWVALHQRRSIVATSHAKVVLALPLSALTMRLHGLCYVVLGTLAMLRGMYREGVDYFLFVGGMKDTLRFFLPKPLATIYLCSCYFLTGHLSLLQSQAEESKRESLNHGQYRWYQLYAFLHARSMFELGYYQESHSLCINQSGFLQRIFALWDGRSLAYLGLLVSAIDKLSSLPSSAERNLFLGEAYIFSQQYHHAQEVLEEGIRLIKTESFSPSSPLVIPNGFFALEGLIPEVGVRELSRLLYAMCAYAMSCMGKSSEALKILEPFIPQNRDAGGGAYDPMIYFLGAEIAFNSGQTEQRSVAYLSKGIVVLKERASLLQKVQVKDQYLFHHYWHSRLMQKAKEYYIT